MKVSIIVPYVRTEFLERCIMSAVENPGIPKSEYELIIRGDVDGIGCPRMVEHLVSLTRGDCIVFIGDDCIPQKDWLKIALEINETKWGLVGFNDLTGRDLPCHWLADRRLLPHLDGQFFHTEYYHCFCDNELMDRCIELDRYTYSREAVVEHRHPYLCRDTPMDKFYQKAYSTYSEDRDLYNRRKDNKWKIKKQK